MAQAEPGGDLSAGGFAGGGWSGAHDPAMAGQQSAFGPEWDRAVHDAQVAAALGPYGVSPYDLVDWENNQNYKDQINGLLDQMGGWATTREFARGMLGMSTLRSLTGYYSPTEQQAMGLAGKAFATFGGLPGVLAAGLMRGGAAIGTGKSERDFGGGFGKGDRTGGPGIDRTPTVAESLGQQPPKTVEEATGTLAAQRELLMSDYWKNDRLAELRQLLAEIEALRQSQAPTFRPTPQVRI